MMLVPAIFKENDNIWWQNIEFLLYEYLLYEYLHNFQPLEMSFQVPCRVTSGQNMIVFFFKSK